MHKARISSLCVALADKEVNVLEETLTNEGALFSERFVASTGIQKTHILGENQSCLDLAEKAARHAMSCKDFKALFVVTQSFTPRSPGLAHALHRKLGLDEKIPVFELNSACQGFVTALRFIVGTGMPMLLVTCDTLGSLSRKVSQDRSIKYLFSDAASACVVTSFDQGPWFNKTLSNFNEKLQMSENSMEMDGEAIQFVAIKYVPEALNFLGSKVTPNFLHQANKSILDRISKKTGMLIPTSFDRTANTTSSSIPTVIAHYFSKNDFVSGSYTLCGFGAGFSIDATQALICDKPKFV